MRISKSYINSLLEEDTKLRSSAPDDSQLYNLSDLHDGRQTLDFPKVVEDSDCLPVFKLWTPPPECVQKEPVEWVTPHTMYNSYQKRFPLGVYILNKLKENGHNAVIAGGSLAAVYQQERFGNFKDIFGYYNNLIDVDIFPIGIDAKSRVTIPICFLKAVTEWTEANESVDERERRLFRNGRLFSASLHRGLLQVVTRSGVKIQLIMRTFPSVSKLLHGFDIPASSIAWDGDNIFFTKLSSFCYMNSCNPVHLPYRSTTLETRLKKYFERGFSIALPHINPDALSKLGTVGRLKTKYSYLGNWILELVDSEVPYPWCKRLSDEGLIPLGGGLICLYPIHFDHKTNIARGFITDPVISSGEYRCTTRSPESLPPKRASSDYCEKDDNPWLWKRYAYYCWLRSEKIHEIGLSSNGRVLQQQSPDTSGTQHSFAITYDYPLHKKRMIRDISSTEQIPLSSILLEEYIEFVLSEPLAKNMGVTAPRMDDVVPGPVMAAGFGKTDWKEIQEWPRSRWIETFNQRKKLILDRFQENRNRNFNFWIIDPVDPQESFTCSLNPTPIEDPSEWYGEYICPNI